MCVKSCVYVVGISVFNTCILLWCTLVMVSVCRHYGIDYRQCVYNNEVNVRLCSCGVRFGEEERE